MEISKAIKDKVHEQMLQLAKQQEEIILHVYEETYKDMPKDFTPEQQARLMDNVFGTISQAYMHALDEQKKQADSFFADKKNVQDIISKVKQEQNNGRK